ncbi:chemotaxis protein CheA [Sediminitomix flava]|uniref:Chemotaxis protein CheA n=1 Tax=Sediminitomix flava TaxID=379075 RepID=A0A315Z697_SEDFL|nr:chemotaxis protein CheA [Sediminitomix flava]PWJ39397.1 two-component system chemotaxis sensor kinase CheA [Sediminitomix flava]
MNSKDEELKQIFFAEALDNFEELNRLFTELEKEHSNKNAIEAVFRITHTLKANAAAMGFEAIASLAHLLEDIFSEIKNNRMELTTAIFNDLFRAVDKLGELIQGVKTDESVSYKGIEAKLKIILRKVKEIPVPEPKSDNSKKQEKEKLDKLNEEVKEAKKSSSPQISFSDLVQVPVNKLDNLLNLVGELAIEKDRLITVYGQKGGNDFARLYRISSDLQYSVMGVRLVQINVLFNKFHRIVRDVAQLENKKVNLVLEGTEIEIDRNILQIISDSLIHLVRNAVSHGLESKEEREKTGKNEAGTLTLRANNDKDHVIIDIIDDGKGIDANIIRKKVLEKGLITADIANTISDDEIVKYIFEPGFSSRDTVSEISGRGVGMDVVKRAIDSIGGKITFETEVGKGTTFSMWLPSSMAVKSALLFILGGAEFAIPLSFTEAVISVKKSEVHKVGNGLVATHLDETIAVVFLNDIFRASSVEELYSENILHKTYDSYANDEKLYLIVVSAYNKMVGFVVDKLLQQKEIIEKPLGKPVENVRFISGATIMGNGNVCLTLDIPSILEYLFNSSTAKLKTLNS